MDVTGAYRQPRLHPSGQTNSEAFSSWFWFQRFTITGVARGLDPRVHLLAKMMDCRVKPGNDS
jgi:hypothetical protein